MHLHKDYFHKMVRIVEKEDRIYLCLGLYSNEVAKIMNKVLDSVVLPSYLEADCMFCKDSIDGYIRRIDDGELAVVPKLAKQYKLNLRHSARIGNNYKGKRRLENYGDEFNCKEHFCKYEKCDYYQECLKNCWLDRLIYVLEIFPQEQMNAKELQSLDKIMKMLLDEKDDYADLKGQPLDPFRINALNTLKSSLYVSLERLGYFPLEMKKEYDRLKYEQD